MNNFQSLAKNALLVLLTWSGFTSCGVTSSSGALPQAVIPNELITVSSPDADGIVTVTGAASAVPALAIIIVEVSAGTATNQIHRLSLPDWLVNPAYAATCTSDLPACPTLDEDGKCQDSSDATGAFILTVPATSTSTLTISYLDTESCEETSTFRSGIPDSSEVISLSLDARSLAGSDDTLPNVYLYGRNSEDTNIVHSLNLSTYEETAFSLSITGEPGQAEVVTSTNAGSPVTRLLLTSDEKAVSIDLDTLGQEGSEKSFVDSSGADIPDLEPIDSSEFTGQDSVLSNCSTRLSSSNDYTRVYFHDGTKIYYANDLNSGVNNQTATEAAGIELFEINLVLAASTADLATMTLDRIEYVSVIEDASANKLFLVVTPIDGESSYAFVINESSLIGCNGSHRLYTSDALALTKASSSGFRGRHIDNSDSEDYIFSLFDRDAQTVSIIQAGTSASRIEHVDFTSDAGLDFEVANLKVIYNSTDAQYEYLVVGENTAGSTFYTQGGTSGFDTGANAVAIDPKLIYRSPLDSSKAAIFDLGNSGDGLSNIILMEINDL